MRSSVIALISDLGAKDYFVGAMKGTILSINSNAKIVDITHEVARHDVRAAAFALASAANAFPEGTIFLAVVDPGVGTKRRCILLQTKNGLFFIGPDNGVFTLVAERFGVAKIYEITNKALMNRDISPTFHGRDIMAPVAAHLSLGIKPSEVGPEIKTIKSIEIPHPRVTQLELSGYILNVDNFGNLVTNIDAATALRFAKVGEALKVKIDEKVLKVKFARTFGDVTAGERMCFIGSAGTLEFARNMGNLAEELKIKIGDELIIQR